MGAAVLGIIKLIYGTVLMWYGVREQCTAQVNKDIFGYIRATGLYIVGAVALFAI